MTRDASDGQHSIRRPSMSISKTVVRQLADEIAAKVAEIGIAKDITYKIEGKKFWGDRERLPLVTISGKIGNEKTSATFLIPPDNHIRFIDTEMMRFKKTVKVDTFTPNEKGVDTLSYILTALLVADYFAKPLRKTFSVRKVMSYGKSFVQVLLLVFFEEVPARPTNVAVKIQVFRQTNQAKIAVLRLRPAPEKDEMICEGSLSDIANIRKGLLFMLTV
jgi:hypothetical protein